MGDAFDKNRFQTAARGFSFSGSQKSVRGEIYLLGREVDFLPFEVLCRESRGLLPIGPGDFGIPRKQKK